MKWTFTGALVGLAVAIAACGPEPAPAPAGPVRPASISVACWDDYVTPEVAADYERETGVKVVVEIVNSNELVMERLLGGQVWDVISPSDYAVQMMQEAGLLLRLRHENIRNLGNVARRFQNAAYDRELAYAVPLFWGTTGLGYDRSVYPEPPASWSYVFEPAKRAVAKGRISLLDDLRETLAVALLASGHPPNSVDPDHLAAAVALLRSVRPDLAGFDSETFEDNFGNGTNVLVHGWGGDLAQVMVGQPQLGYVLPAEGFLLFIDNLAIPSATPNRDEAERFIDYMLRPEVAAKLSTANLNPTCNGPGRALIAAEVSSSPSFLLPEEAPFHVLRHLGKNTALYERAWGEVLAP